MKFDNADQKKLALTLIGKVPVSTNLDGLFSGPDKDLRDLVQAMQSAEIAETAEIYTKPELVKE